MLCCVRITTYTVSSYLVILSNIFLLVKNTFIHLHNFIYMIVIIITIIIVIIISVGSLLNDVFFRRSKLLHLSIAIIAIINIIIISINSSSSNNCSKHFLFFILR